MPVGRPWPAHSSPRGEDGRNDHWVVRGGPPGPFDYDTHLPAEMLGGRWPPEAWRPATTTRLPVTASTTARGPGKYCRWKVCSWPQVLPKSTVDVAAWIGSNFLPMVTAGYLAGTNGTLGLSASTTPGPYNVTAAVPSGTDPSAAFLTPMVLSAAVVASASAYGVYRLGCYCLSGQPTAASQSSATDIAEAVLLREV
jgi:hypothetical protein